MSDGCVRHLKVPSCHYVGTEKSKPRFWGNPTQKRRVKKIFLEPILRPISSPISSLPGHLGTGVKMTTKNIFFTLGFWVELPQILVSSFFVQAFYSQLLVQDVIDRSTEVQMKVAKEKTLFQT